MLIHRLDARELLSFGTQGINLDLRPLNVLIGPNGSGKSWFVADRDCLKAYYGQGFNPRKLARRPEVERIPKADLYAALDRATRNCTKGTYEKSKGKHSFSILATVDPGKVAAASPHARRLLGTLREAVAQA